MTDIVMAAFSVFFMQSPSFLAHQRQLARGHGHGRSNCETLFGMTRIPSDNHVRDMLDPVPPECFHARFPHAVFSRLDGNFRADRFVKTASATTQSRANTVS